MKKLVVAILAAAGGLLSVGGLRAQTALLEVQALTDAPLNSPMAQIVRRGTKTEEIAPKLQLRARVFTPVNATFPANLEWYVFGRAVAGQGMAPVLTLMQSSKEAVTVKPPPGAQTSFFAYTPGQVRDGLHSEGWLVRLVAGDGRLLDLKASGEPFLALGRDAVKLTALTVAKTSAEAKRAESGELPAEVMAKIKAKAEANWPGNPEMQAFEIKQATDAHRAAQKK